MHPDLKAQGDGKERRHPPSRTETSGNLQDSQEQGREKGRGKTWGPYRGNEKEVEAREEVRMSKGSRNKKESQTNIYILWRTTKKGIKRDGKGGRVGKKKKEDKLVSLK